MSSFDLVMIICGIIIGFLLGKKIYPNYIYKGPDSNKVKKEILKINNSCYKFSPFPVVCGIKDSY